MTLAEQFSVRNDCYQNNVNKADSRYVTFQTRGALGLMLHSVGCPQPKAQVFADKWNRSYKAGETDSQAAVHAVLEPGSVIQCLPWHYRGLHGGGDSNNTHIGIEMTEPSSIEYTSGAGFTDKNPAKTKAHVLGTYQTAVELFAYLCKLLQLDPIRDGVILSHAEGYKRGIASAHADVEHLWKGFGLTMGQFRQDVKAALGAPAPAPLPPTEENQTPEKEKQEEEDMTREQFNAYMQSWETVNNPTYNSLADVPDYWREDVRVLLEKGYIQGDGVHELGMKRETLRAVIISYRITLG